MSSAGVSKVKRTARRNLFGPVDHAKTDKWLAEKLDRIREQSELRWNFSFAMESPLPGPSEYEFEPLADGDVPAFYRMKTYGLDSMSPRSNLENESPSRNSESSESDTSMDVSISPVPVSRRTCATPKKRQGKVTDYLKVTKKRLQRSPKTVDIVLPNASHRTNSV